MPFDTSEVTSPELEKLDAMLNDLSSFRRWVKGAEKSLYGHHCIMGALKESYGLKLSPFVGTYYQIERLQCRDSFFRLQALIADVIRDTKRYCRKFEDNSEQIEGFNDHWRTKFTDVRDVLLETRQRLVQIALTEKGE